MGYRELTALLILLPFIAAPLYSLFKGKRIQTFGVISTGILLGLGALFMIPQVPFSFSPEPLGPLKPATLIEGGDFALLLLFLYYGFAHRHRVIQLLSGLQILLPIFIQLVKMCGWGAEVFATGQIPKCPDGPYCAEVIGSARSLVGPQDGHVHDA